MYRTLRQGSSQGERKCNASGKDTTEGLMEGEESVHNVMIILGHNDQRCLASVEFCIVDHGKAGGQRSYKELGVMCWHLVLKCITSKVEIGI
eukprot:6167243-Ditylum_brightwellii.AAC.1